MNAVVRKRQLIAALLLAFLLYLPPAAAAAENEAGSQGEPAAASSGTGGASNQSAPVAPRANLLELEDEVMCPICGTLLGMSRAPAAERQRLFMRGLIEEGRTEQQIKDALVAEYGPQVLALPDDEDTNFYIYVVPVAGLIIAALAVLWSAIRWRRNREDEGPPDSGGSGAGPSGPDSSRLDRDLAEYDL